VFELGLGTSMGDLMGWLDLNVASIL
jgi:hypothetical protein